MDLSPVRVYTDKFRALTKLLHCNAAELDLILVLLDSIKDDDKTLDRMSRETFADLVKRRYADFSIDGLKSEIAIRLEMTLESMEALCKVLPVVRDAVAKALEEMRPTPEPGATP